MKPFLRYQLSGGTFILWLTAFYVEKNYLELTAADNIGEDFIFKILAGLLSCYPIGALIHQLSVYIKNSLLARFYPILSDSPFNFDICFIANISGKDDNKGKELSEYIATKVSSLNSYYYVRFDNGFLAPLLAYFTAAFSVGLGRYTISIMFISFILTCSYIPIIYYDLKMYKELMNTSVSAECGSTKNYPKLNEILEDKRKYIYCLIYIFVFLILILIFILDSYRK